MKSKNINLTPNFVHTSITICFDGKIKETKENKYIFAYI